MTSILQVSNFLMVHGFNHVLQEVLVTRSEPFPPSSNGLRMAFFATTEMPIENTLRWAVGTEHPKVEEIQDGSLWSLSDNYRRHALLG